MDFALPTPPIAAPPAGDVSAYLTKPGSRAAAERAAREFEAVFIGQMTEAMFSGLGAQAPFGGGQAETLWRSMLAQETGRSIAQAGGIGIADTVMRALVAQQEESR